ncbi:MAG TPA: CoB--CoM heterodisulfide reductase iron-sulfur subunit B family protein [Anaerolineae bacterium]|nr:CoB--CoM heterodisulfide reductase iron-sulfur subunit B family protein [Anaerolineae bacterium]
MKYAYYPGCSLHSTSREYDISTKAVCQALEIELDEIPGWICCGASSGHMTSELLALALPVKNLVLAREMALDTAVACAACYSRLKVANKVMRSNGDARVGYVDKTVGSTYRGEAKVKHLLEVVIDEYGLAALRDKVRRPLAGLRIAAYYGCLLVRPPEVTQFDDPEDPTTMERLISALGAEPIDWPYKTECCGGSLALTRTHIVAKLCHDILQMAADEGAECIMVACPLCQSSLDLRQAQVNRQYKTDFHMPVLYFTQLIGLALDVGNKELGLSRLIVSPDSLLRAKALI